MRLPLLLTFSGLLLAGSSVQGPRLGYIPFEGGVRSILGIFGAARLGPPVAQDLRHATALPGTHLIAGVDAGGDLVRSDLRDGTSNTLGIKKVSGIVASPGGQAILAVAGETAYLISRAGEKLAEFVLPGIPAQAAVADAGPAAAIVVSEGDAEVLYVLDTHGARRVLHASRLPAVAFLPASRDLVIANESGAIYRLGRDLQLTQVGTVEGAQALAVTADGQRVLAVAGTSIHPFRFDGTPLEVVNCSCTATMAEPLGDSVFQITTGDDGPLWIADASGEKLRVAFVPESMN